MSSTLIYNADVWLWDAALEGQHFGFVRQNAFMVMKNGFITRISESSEECPSMESFDVIINAHGRLVLPGLIGTSLLAHMCTRISFNLWILLPYRFSHPHWVVWGEQVLCGPVRVLLD